MPPCPLPLPRQLVELKNGETYNGHMVQCDTWMNIHLREVICTSKVCSAAQGGTRHSNGHAAPVAGG